MRATTKLRATSSNRSLACASAIVQRAPSPGKALTTSPAVSAAAADKAGLVVRAFPGEGARCTIAETEANDLLLQVARDFVVARTF